MARRVLIFGDSNGLPRPEIEAAETYPAVLSQLLGPGWEVENHSEGGTTTRKLFHRWQMVSRGGEVVVIQTGITEGAPRPIPWKLRQVIGRLGPLKKPIVKWLHDNRERLIRKKAHFMTPPEVVGSVLGHWLGASTAQGSVLVVVAVPDSVGPAMETRSPGAEQAYWVLNQHLQQAAGERLLEVGEIPLLSDGHHFSVEGHRRLAEQLAERLNRIPLG